MVRKNPAKTLARINPNVGIAVAYRKRILRLVDEMARSVEHWLRAAYRANPPVMAQDATPAAELQAAIGRLVRRWEKRFDGAAPELADYFTLRASRRTDAALQKILRDAGVSVRFKMTPAMRDILRATVEENVGLIRSIPQQYLGEVQGMVMRSVVAGRDLESLTKDLRKRYGVTRRRAELIARDQNNKATSAMLRARHLEVGMEEGVWIHSHAGKKPRPTHLANDQKRFSIKDGWFDPDPRVRRNIWPGQEINCRCTWRPVVAGFS